MSFRHKMPPLHVSCLHVSLLPPSSLPTPPPPHSPTHHPPTLRRVFLLPRHPRDRQHLLHHAHPRPRIQLRVVRIQNRQLVHPLPPAQPRIIIVFRHQQIRRTPVITRHQRSRHHARRI